MSAYVQYGVAAGDAERLEAVRRAGWSSAAALGANGFQGRRERGGVGGDVDGGYGGEKKGEYFSHH